MTIFGKLSHYKTPMHRVDARVKLFGLIALMVLCFLPYGNYTNRFVILGFLGILTLILMIVSKVSFLQFLKSLRGLWFMMVFLVIVFVFVQTSSDVSSLHPMIVFPNGYTLYWEGVFQSLHIFYRFTLMLAFTLIFTSTTSPIDITFALEWYLTPLRLMKFPTQILTMIFTLALRFIPTLLEETQKIMKAQRSRGVDYNRGFVAKKVRSIITLIIPLLISCFSRSVDLSYAMDARGYNPYGKRTSYKILKFTYRDVISLIVILLLLGGYITLCVYINNVQGWDNMLNLFFGWPTF